MHNLYLLILELADAKGTLFLDRSQLRTNNKICKYIEYFFINSFVFCESWHPFLVEFSRLLIQLSKATKIEFDVYYYSRGFETN